MTGALIVRFRDPKNPLNRSFYNFYLYFSLGFVINIMYRLFASDFWKAFLGRVTIGFTIFAFIFLLQFNLILLNKELFNRKWRWITTIAWLLLCTGFLFVDWNNGTSWLVSTEYPSGVPVWSTTFTLFSLVLSQMLIMVIFIVANISKRKMDPNQSKAKHFSKNLAIFFFDWFVVGNILNNWVIMRNTATWFSSFMFYTTFLGLPGIIMYWLYAIRKVE